MRTVCSEAAEVKPGSTACSARSVRIISPALTSSTKASASCATTSVLRARWRARPSVNVRPASRAATSGDACFTAAIAPKTSPAASETTSVKATARKSIDTS